MSHSRGKHSLDDATARPLAKIKHGLPHRMYTKAALQAYKEWTWGLCPTPGGGCLARIGVGSCDDEGTVRFAVQVLLLVDRRSARSRIVRASAFFFSSEWPFLAPVSFTFMT